MGKGRKLHQTVALGSHTSQGNADYSDLNCFVLFTQQTLTLSMLVWLVYQRA